MRVLLDTHILLWAVGEPAKLPPQARQAILDPTNEILFSAASIWEIAIKAQLRRRDFAADAAEVAGAAVDSGFDELPVRAQHGALTARLPMHHRDPFDRLLIAQAMTEPSHLLTVDTTLQRYSDLVLVL
ncbi:MAG TPA: type II toxin-antitoxin system VapC family toxin [Casimicrobiaceae bacterium]|jgi:PIN domain nuclease of toxin-antitoxin system